MSDLISRQVAIDTVMEFMPSLTTPDGCGQFDREIFEAQEMFVDIGQALNKLPSEPHWIPCSERLPEARRSVILSTKEWTGEGCYWETTTNHVIWKGYRWNATYWDDEVIAWMPLPDCYQGGEVMSRIMKVTCDWCDTDITNTEYQTMTFRRYAGINHEKVYRLPTMWMCDKCYKKLAFKMSFPPCEGKEGEME